MNETNDARDRAEAGAAVTQRRKVLEDAHARLVDETRRIVEGLARNTPTTLPAFRSGFRGRIQSAGRQSPSSALECFSANLTDSANRACVASSRAVSGVISPRHVAASHDDGGPTD